MKLTVDDLVVEHEMQARPSDLLQHLDRAYSYLRGFLEMKLSQGPTPERYLDLTLEVKPLDRLITLDESEGKRGGGGRCEGEQSSSVSSNNRGS